MARARLTSQDVQGAWVIIPTPSKPNASDWRAENTVDLEETARAVEGLIAAGIDGLMTLGTFGEGSTLTWEEKRDFVKTIVDTVRGRIPYFAGATSLNTRETVRQMRAVRDLGADGVMLGIPMWCEMETPGAVQYYKDVTEGCPELAICVYANPEAFKYEFPPPFWAQVAEIPQIVSAKYMNIGTLRTDVRNTKGRIRFLLSDGQYYQAARIEPEQVTAFWSSGACCGPSVTIRLRDEIAKAKKTHEWKAATEIADAIAVAGATLFPRGSFNEFSKYNIGLEKARIDAAGWMKAGPCRPPYHVIPEAYLEGARKSGRAWAELHAKHAGSVKVAAE
jgi:trans-o-hydroxybenzylidenepyruvate hydratase-aldolase